MSGGSGLSGDAAAGIKGYHQLKKYRRVRDILALTLILALLGQVIYWPR